MVMENSYMFAVVLAFLTILVWLAQEIIGRQRQYSKLLNQSGNSREIPVMPIGEPLWSMWGYKVVLVLWCIWFAVFAIIKDCDFSAVLVLFTLLSGAVAEMDRLFMQRRRINLSRILGESPVAAKSPAQIAGYCRSFFPVLVVVLVLRSFVLEPFQIPSSSMTPTLEVGDYIVVSKFSYGLRFPIIRSTIIPVGTPRRGDVVVFNSIEEGKEHIFLIKRLIGLPGDHIEYRNKTIYINGVRADQELLAELPPTQPAQELDAEKLGNVTHSIYKIYGSYNVAADVVDVHIQPNHYFFMGDNRDNSADSRFFGQVPDKMIVGKAVAVWMHWRDLFSLPEFHQLRMIN